MADKITFHDEEYQFPQDDYIEDLQVEQPASETEAQEKPGLDIEAPAPAGLASMWASNKRMIIGIGVLVVVAIVFSVMRVMHKPADTISTAPAAGPVATVVQQPIIDPQVIAQLTSLKSDSMNNGAVIRQLQAQVQQLTNALNQARAQQQQSNQSLMILVSQVQQLTAQVKALTQPKLVKVGKAAPKVDLAPVITFQLRAVVPGRAWIVGSDGQSQSVAVGDHVDQYGTVQSIDADAGVVITTSGKTIKFS